MFDLISNEEAHRLTVLKLERALEALKSKDYKEALVVTNEVSASIASCFFEDVRRLVAERNALQASCREYNEKLTQLEEEYDIKYDAAMPT